MLVDTDILIDYLRGKAPSISFVENNLNRIRVSSISVAELYHGVRQGKEREHLDAMISALTVLPVSEEIARQGGLLCRKYRRAHGCGLGDCLIAATALTHALPLKTLNEKHYPMIEEAEAPYRKA